MRDSLFRFVMMTMSPILWLSIWWPQVLLGIFTSRDDVSYQFYGRGPFIFSVIELICQRVDYFFALNVESSYIVSRLKSLEVLCRICGRSLCFDQQYRQGTSSAACFFTGCPNKLWWRLLILKIRPCCMPFISGISVGGSLPMNASLDVAGPPYE